MKKMIVIALTLMLIVCCSTGAFADSYITGDSNDSPSRAEIDEVLVKNGYSIETAKALNDVDAQQVWKDIEEGKEVSISTSTMDIDNFKVVEAILSHSDEELLNEGFTKDDIEMNRKEIEKMFSMTDLELQKTYGLTSSDVSALKAIGQSTKAGVLHDNSRVVATPKGSISTTTLTYTMAVTNNSTSSAPNYRVVCSYNWSKVFALASFKDCITVGWGGGMNSKNESGTAKYYTITNSGWGTQKSTKSMSKTAKVNKGMVFEFPQGYYYNNNVAVKSKKGSASLTVYQTKKVGKDTKIISQYGHGRVNANVDITISVSGPSISVSLGTGYDKSPQVSKKVVY